MGTNPTFSSYVNAEPSLADGARVLKALPVIASGSATIDLTQDAVGAGLRFVQTVYFDLADFGTNAVVTLTHLPTGFRVRVKGGTQGWFPISCNDAMQFRLDVTNIANGATVPMWFGNFVAPNFQWPSV